MSTRKTKILEIAVNLFNEKGCLNVSTRHIADELGISVGNLYYYFKNKEDIIISVYDELTTYVFSQIKSVENKENLAFDYYYFMKEQMKYELKYSFLRMEMNSICQKYPKIKKIFENNIILKKEQLKNLYLHQMKHGFMKKLDEMELEFLISNSWIIISQWEIYWQLLICKNVKEKREKGILNILYFIKPYMTEVGLKESNLLKSIKYLTQGIKNA